MSIHYQTNLDSKKTNQANYNLNMATWRIIENRIFSSEDIRRYFSIHENTVRHNEIYNVEMKMAVRHFDYQCDPKIKGKFKLQYI